MDALATLAKLDALCALDAPAEVSVEPIPRRWAKSWFDQERQVYRIALHPACTQSEIESEAIMHEWAHCMTTCDCLLPHCKHWGECYARCVSACEE